MDFSSKYEPAQTETFFNEKMPQIKYNTNMHPKTEQQTPNQLIMSKYSDLQTIEKNSLQTLARIGGSFNGSQNHKRIHSHANEK